MANDKKIIVEVDIKRDKATENAAALIKSIFDLRKQLAEAKKAFDASGGTSTEYANKINELEQAIKQNTSALTRERNAMSANANSMQALRAQTNLLSAEMESLDTSTEAGAKRFEELQTQLKANRELINENSKAAGSFKDNIGNYAESIKEAAAGNALFGGTFTQFIEVTQIANNTFKAFNITIAANPLGALLALLVAIAGALYTFLQRTEKGRAILEKLGTAAEFAFGFILQTIAKAGEAIYDFGVLLFEEPQKALEKVKEAFIAFGNFYLDYWRNLGKIIKGALTFDSDEINAGIDGLKAQLDTILKPAQDFAQGMADAAEQGAKVAEQNRRLRASIRALGIEIERQNKISEQQKTLADDENKTLRERIDAINTAEQAEIAYTKAKTAQINARIAIINNEIAATKQSTEAQKDELASLRAELEAAAGEAAERYAEIQGTRFALVEELKTQNGALKASAIQLADAQSEATKQIYEDRQKLFTQGNEITERTIANLDREVEAIKKKQEAQKLFDEQAKASEGAFMELTNGIVQAYGEQTEAARLAIFAQKSFNAAMVLSNLPTEISGIWKNANQIPPPFGQIFGAVQTGAAIFRAGKAVADIKAVAGFADGGYTGDGGKYEFAGYVHKGEVVFPQESVKAIGASNLLAMINSTKKGYANGGMVGQTVRDITARPSFAMGDFATLIKNMPSPVVAVTDIRKGFENVNRVTSVADR